MKTHTDCASQHRNLLKKCTLFTDQYLYFLLQRVNKVAMVWSRVHLGPCDSNPFWFQTYIHIIHINQISTQTNDEQLVLYVCLSYFKRHVHLWSLFLFIYLIGPRKESGESDLLSYRSISLVFLTPTTMSMSVSLNLELWLVEWLKL